jgi:hypothetical protein
MDAAETTDEVETAVEAERKAERDERSSRWAGRALVAIVAVTVCYLGATFLNPRVVPRLSVLPAPPSRTWFDTCEGRPLNRHTEQWQRDGFLWIRTEFSTLAGCISDTP